MRIFKFIDFLTNNGFAVEFFKGGCNVDFGKGFIFTFKGDYESVMDQVSEFIKKGKHNDQLVDLSNAIESSCFRNLQSRK